MVTARDIMIIDAPSISSEETLGDAAVKMRDLNVASLPICGSDGQLSGVLTDRDIVVGCIADGRDPFSTQAGDYADVAPPAIDIDDSLENALMTMAEHHLHQLPVTEGAHLVGIVADSDVAQWVPNAAVAELLDYPHGPRRAC